MEITEDGKIEHNIEIPQQISNSIGFGLFIRNDSILIKNDRDHETFYFDTRYLQWIKVKEADDLIFEDEDFYVTSMDFGEWGNTVWFRDKKTGKEYELGSNSKNVNKINNTYYLTSDDKIIKINDPLKLKSSDLNYYYETVEKSDSFYNGSESLIGSELIFKKQTQEYEWLTQKFYITTSFISDNQLYHLCVDSNLLYIGKVDNGIMKPLRIIGNDLIVYSWHHSLNGKIQKENRQTLVFVTKNENYFGIIELIDDKIYIHYFKHDLVPVKHLGPENANRAFANTFEYINSNIDSMHLRQLDSIELEMGGLDLKHGQKRELGDFFYPNKIKLDFEGTKIYLKVEDSTFHNTVEYFYTKEDSLVKTILFEWSDHKFANKLTESSNIVEEKNTIRFQNKISELEKFVTKKIGKPKKKKKDSDNNIDIIWKTKEGFTVNLFGYRNDWRIELRMYIYKE